MIYSCRVIAADGGGSIKNGGKHILLGVSDFGRITTHTLYDVFDVFTVNIHKSFYDIFHTMRITCPFVFCFPC